MSKWLAPTMRDERPKRSATELLFGTRRLNQKHVAERLAKVTTRFAHPR
jgi:hypothetical protein